MSLTRKSIVIAAAAAILLCSSATTKPAHARTSAEADTTATPRHCQVPCGIYSDKMRIDMFMEDAATIEKAMASLEAMDKEEKPSKNQIVRWVMAKDDHAQAIQDRVSAYWLAQRIKVPAEGADAATVELYLTQLRFLHQMTVVAMKCKQTTDKTHVATLRRLVLDFSKSYFKPEDLEHIEKHHGAADHDHKGK